MSRTQIPISVAAAKSASPATPTPAANSVPKAQKVADPKKIVPAPTVVAVGKGPRIAFTNEEIDFGDVSFNDVVQAPFEFKNIGDEPLTISKVQVEVGEGC
ncbi:MAG: DUF1573 domain-containing protein [Chloroflexi bacterium]|nr:DUF1573 domain-containing protein [Chloroflexota bacterium]